MAAAAAGVGPATGRVTGTLGRGAAGWTGASALPAPKRRLLRVPATGASASGPAHQGLVLWPRRRKDGVVGRANAADGVAGRPPEVDDMVVGRAEVVEEGRGRRGQPVRRREGAGAADPAARGIGGGGSGGRRR